MCLPFGSVLASLCRWMNLTHIHSSTLRKPIRVYRCAVNPSAWPCVSITWGAASFCSTELQRFTARILMALSYHVIVRYVYKANHCLVLLRRSYALHPPGGRCGVIDQSCTDVKLDPDPINDGFNGDTGLPKQLLFDKCSHLGQSINGGARLVRIN
jgi:hypothetical protein